jgi:hypothetical protein
MEDNPDGIKVVAAVDEVMSELARRITRLERGR